jgi:hypothetical protein
MASSVPDANNAHHKPGLTAVGRSIRPFNLNLMLRAWLLPSGCAAQAGNLLNGLSWYSL